MFAARREHLDKVILSALDEGTWVVCDRFTDASYAYQAAGSGVEWDKIAALEAWVHGELQPDLTLYFDVSPEIAKARRQRRADARPLRAGARGVPRTGAGQGYLRRAARNPDRIRVVDASKPRPDNSGRA